MKIGMMTVIVDVIRKRGSNNMWDKYIPDANESIVPETFRASDAMYHHNKEVFNLESRINVLEFENDKLLEILEKIDSKLGNNNLFRSDHILNEIKASIKKLKGK